eukprot:1157729-Pelagomonas_calceolata.AAC.2
MHVICMPLLHANVLHASRMFTTFHMRPKKCTLAENVQCLFKASDTGLTIWSASYKKRLMIDLCA